MTPPEAQTYQELIGAPRMQERLLASGLVKLRILETMLVRATSSISGRSR
jgi:hypothetical protein